MKKLFVLMVSVLLTMALISGCAGNTQTTSTTETEATTTEAAATVESDADVIEIALIVKATDSTFWQSVISGGEAFDADNANVHVTVYGPASESNIDESITILEDVITSEPDAIVIATNAGEGAVAAIEEATEKGIVVVSIDTSIPSDKIATHLATDNELGGALAAEEMVRQLQAAGKELKGTVALVSAVAGVQTVLERDGGFADKLAELAPDIEILDPVYCDNEIATAMSETEQIITREGDNLIGIYADNNHMGDGVGMAIKQAGLQDDVFIVAFDNDEDEINFLKEGVLKALIIQDSYNMGYAGCEYAVKVLNGETVSAFIDTGVKVTTAENVE